MSTPIIYLVTYVAFALVMLAVKFIYEKVTAFRGNKKSINIVTTSIAWTIFCLVAGVWLPWFFLMAAISLAQTSLAIIIEGFVIKVNKPLAEDFDTSPEH